MPVESLNPEQMAMQPQAAEQISSPAPVQTPAPEQQSSFSPAAGGGGPNSFAPQGGGSVDVREALSRAGFDSSGFQDQQSALESTIAALRQMQQYTPLVQYGQEYMRYKDQFEQWRQQQAAQQTPPASAGGWSMPKYDQSWDQLTRWDPSLGRYVTIDPINVSPAVAEARNQYQAALKNNFNQFMENPVDTLWGAGLEQRIQSIREEIREEFRQELAQQEAVRRQTEYLAANERDFYILNEYGQHVIDPMTGQEALTPKGNVALQAALRCRNEFGITDPMQIQEYVRDALEFAEAKGLFGGGSQPPTPQQAPQTPADVGNQRKQAFVNRAVKSNNRNGSEHPADAGVPTPMQNPDATLREMNREELRKRGALPQTG